MSTLLADVGLEKANHTAAVIGARLTDTQANVVSLRDRIASLALVATIDPDREPELIEARTRLAESETRMRELGAAEVLAKSLAHDAKALALAASARADWDEARRALDESVVTARALEDVARQLGDLHRRLQSELRTAAVRTAPHLKRDEYKMLVQPPNLNETLKLLIANAGGPPVPERDMLHLDAGQRAGASVVGVVEHHAKRVMDFRPADMAEQKDADHG